MGVMPSAVFLPQNALPGTLKVSQRFSGILRPLWGVSQGKRIIWGWRGKRGRPWDSIGREQM